MRVRRAWLFVCCLVLLASCSTRFFYDQLDWFIAWRVGSFVELKPSQEAAFREDLRTHLDLVRSRDLPRIATAIDELAVQVEMNSLSVDNIEAIYQRMLAETDQLMIGLVPLSARLLSQLSDEQQLELFDNLGELNDEFYETYSGTTPEERRKNRNKSTTKAIQRFTGRLSKEQKALIDESLTSMADASVEWIDYQREWQKRFFQLLRDRPAKPEYEERLTQLFVYPRNFHSKEYRARVDSNRQIMNRMTVELATGLTDKQRGKVIKKLNEYSELLTGLAETR